MKGQTEIVNALNEVLKAELTAINQYFLHAEMCENWGYLRLYKKIRAESIDEMKHADVLIDRILYLEGTPNMSQLFPMTIGKTVPDMLKGDLELERQAIDRLNTFIPMCEKAGDHGTADILRKILDSEEEHTDWLEAQLEQMEQIGIPHYLAQQVRPEGE